MTAMAAGRGLAVLLFQVAAGAMPVADALAQQSPELPDKTTTEAAPAGSPFTKGKGPGRGNSYLERFEEDYSYLRDPSLATDPFDPLKFIPLDSDGDAYLTLNGEIRFRYDDTDHKNFLIAPSVVPAKGVGRTPTYGSATGVDTNQLYRQRYEVGADLHLGPNFRLYGELYNGQQTGHDVGGPVPGNLRDDLGLENGFAELYDVSDAAKSGLRVGRQEVFLGNDLQVRANVSTNLPSPVFDGVRAYRDWGYARVDAFAYNVVDFENGVLEDRDNAHTNLWGVYTSYDLPKITAFGDWHGTADFFYLGWRSSAAANGKGSAVYDDRAFLTGATIVAATGAGFVASQDHRDTFGLRGSGGAGAVDYDWQGAGQTGSYGGLGVAAFAFNTDTGYTFHGVPWTPRLGAHIDGASGGAGSGGMHTYQPMYPNTQYYAPNNEFAPTNFYDFAPRVDVTPLPNVKAEAYYSFLWRYSQSDAIYTGAPWPGGNGQNSYAATALAPGRVIGQQADLRLTWTITPHVLTLFEAAIFHPGAALRTAGGKTTTYLDANLTFKF